MATEHWCKEHQTVWFKKGKMKGYAHPVLDENGEETGKWCNEPEGKALEPQPDDMTKEDWANKDKIRAESIEIQNAYTGIPALVEALGKDPNDPLLKAAYNYAMSKLGNWSSVGVELTIKPAIKAHPKDAKKNIEDLWPEPQSDEEAKAKAEELAPILKEKLEEEEAIKNGVVNMVWLNKSLLTLQEKGVKAYSNKTILSYLDAITREKNKDIAEAVTKLNKAQALEFTNRVKDAVDKL